MAEETGVIAAGIGLLVLFRIFSLARSRAAGPAADDRLLVSEFRETGHRHPVRPRGVVTQGAYVVPYLVHWLLSYLPPRHDRRVMTYTTYVFDLLLLTAAGAVASFAGLSPVGIGIALALVVTTPQFVRHDREQSAGIDTVRAGSILAVLGLGALFDWTGGGSVGFLAAAIGLGALAYVTDRTIGRAYLLVTVGSVVVFPSAAVVTLSVPVAVLALARGSGLRILLAEIKYAFDSLLREYSYVEGRRTVDSPVRALLLAVANNPVVVAAGVVLLANGALSSAVPTGYGVWAGTALLVGVLAALRPLYALGNPGELVGFAVVPASVIVGNAWGDLGAPLRLLVGAVVTAGVLGHVLHWRLSDSSEDSKHWDDILEVFEGMEVPGVVAVQPSHRAREIAVRTDHKVVDCAGNEESSTDQIRLLFPNEYRVFSEDIEMIRYYFRPDWAVVDTDRVGASSRWRPNFADPVHENDRYELYEFRHLFPETTQRDDAGGQPSAS